METHITQQNLKIIHSRLKESAKKRNIHFDLSESDIDDIGIPIHCPILGLKLAFNRGKQLDNSISFDRINSAEGYTRDNIIIVSMRANRLKSDATLKELQQISSYYTILNESIFAGDE